MADRFRITHPLRISFTDGEQPTAAKLTVMATQARQGAILLEQAVGDIWNQSGDSVLVNSPLQIPNLARAIGELRYLNPTLYPVDQDFTYRDNVGTKYEDKGEGFLQFKPKSLADVSAVGGSTNLTDKKNNEYEVENAGDWWVDQDTGRWKTYSPLDTSDKFDYVVDSNQWVVGDETRPNVIPDPRQATYTSCRVSKTGSDFFLHLPPRRPLVLSGTELPAKYPPSSEIADNIATTTGAPHKLWQSGAVDALAEAHYRYSLPKEITDVLSGLSIGDALPQGFLYLWNQTTSTILQDVIFRKSAAGTWVFQISSLNTDLDAYVTASESEANYSGTDLTVITIGSPIARSVWTLANALGQPNYLNAGAPNLSHNNLEEVNPYQDGTGRYPTTAPSVWFPSRWENDPHTSLLSRAGSHIVASGINRDINNNAMLGDLLLASTLEDSGNFLNLLDDSNRLVFGTQEDGPSIYFSPTISGLIFDGATFPMQMYSTGPLTIDNLGVGNGITVTAGTSDGIGILATGGPDDGIGVQGVGIRDGVGVLGLGSELGSSNTAGDGVSGIGGTFVSGLIDGGVGVRAQGGDATLHWSLFGGVGGAGIVSQGGNGGTGAISGIVAGDGGTGVIGIGGDGGAPNGASGGTGGTGVWGTGGLGTGVAFGIGVHGTGAGTGPGVFGEGGPSGSTETQGIGVRGAGGGSFGIGVRGDGAGTGTGVLGFGGATGRGVVAEADTTSPVRAAFRIVPQDAQPTGANLVGDIYVTTAGVLKICTVAGTPGTWVSVGAQT